MKFELKYCDSGVLRILMTAETDLDRLIVRGFVNHPERLHVGMSGRDDHTSYVGIDWLDEDGWAERQK